MVKVEEMKMSANPKEAEAKAEVIADRDSKRNNWKKKKNNKMMVDRIQVKITMFLESISKESYDDSLSRGEATMGLLMVLHNFLITIKHCLPFCQLLLLIIF